MSLPLPAHLTLRHGELHFEDVPLERLAREHGTPLFVYSKAAILQAIEMTPSEQSRRMRSMRRKVRENDVAAWSASFLRALSEAHGDRGQS